MIMQKLGRAPRVGDRVDLGNVRLEVEQIEGARVASAMITLRAFEEGSAGA
ncbi:MAG: transporter associated domain-containing protein [Planctomycetota bacterium]